ncbi:hypothetical protein CYR79_09850 [Ligilactobacillus agilis]|uniref:Uncharacterized protein n=1 Tax=Ligilactobacillus agilis TaxID=1601 RepID=A0A2I2A8R1_9LACO|nr:phage tail protein [Ligilactobacillus agilis]PLA75779.1 hypothetical protein CYR79_09850 [Ligilactobacillus agilis]
MQIYILNRARETLATTASIYNDKHTLTLEAGSSSYEFTIDKSDEASHYLDSGNYIVLQDDKGKTWLFTILDYEETHNTKTVYAEDAGIELINKAVDIWKGDGPHPFSYYFDLVTKGTPWKLGVNQLAGLERTLTYEGRDTGLGRLLSILKGFDNAECTFDVTVKMNAPAEFKINVYKQVGNDRSDVQIVYNNELNDITKKESRAEFVTALAGVGGQIQTEDGSEGGNIDFSELEYNKSGFVTKKGDKFLRAVDANRIFNPGQESYIESFYEYDTQSPSELLNRTLSKLKTYSEPQYTYTADVKVIDSSLVLGDTVTILDHDYNPALYLSARVAKLVKSYTDPAQNEIEFTNYRLLNSALADKLARLQVIVNTLPSASRVSAIETNLTKLTKQQEEVIVKVESANGKNTNYYGGSQPESAKQGDSWFYTDEEGNQGIKQYQDGVWVDVISSKFGPKIEADIKQAQADAEALSSEVESAKKQAQEAFAKAGFNADEISNVKTATSEVTETLTSTVRQASELSESLKDVASETASRYSTVSSELSGARNSLTAKASELAKEVASNSANITKANSQLYSQSEGLAKVSQSATKMEQTMTDLSGRVHTVETTASETKEALADAKGNITTLTKRADGTETKIADAQGRVQTLESRAGKWDLELSKKVDNATYNAGIQNLGNQINLKANKTDLDGYATKAQLSVESDRITQQASAISSVTTIANGANSKIDNLSFGGRNLLNGSSTLKIVGQADSNVKDGTWRLSNWGNSTPLQNVTNELPPVVGATNTIKISPLTGVAQDRASLSKGTYTFSVWLKGTKGAKYRIQPFWNNTATYAISGERTLITSDWDRVSFTVDLKTDESVISTAYVYNHDKTNVLYMAAPQLEKGSKPSDYSLSQNDLQRLASEDTASQINQYNTGTVQPIKGIANDALGKANSANDKIDGLRIGGRNLLKGTSDQFKTISNSGWMWAHTWTNNDNNTAKISLANFHTGDYLTYSAWIINDSDVDVIPEVTFFDKNLGVLNGTRGNVLRPGQSGLVTNTRQIGTDDCYVRPTIISTNGQAGVHQIRIKEEMLTLGNVRLPWQPSDLDLPDTIVSTVTTTTNAKQIVDKSGIYSEVTKLVDTKVGNVTTQLETYKHTVDDTGVKLKDVMGALKLDSNGNLTSNFNKLIKTASGVEERYTQLNGKIDGIVVGGKNLLDNSDGQLVMGYEIDNTTWTNGKATLVYNHDYSKTNKSSEILPQTGSRNQWYRVSKDEELTQSIIVETDATYNPNGVYEFTWFTPEFGHRLITANIDVLGTNKYRLWCSFKWDKDLSCNVRIMDIQNLAKVLQINTSGTYISFYHPQIERGNKPSDWGMSDNDINKKISDANASIAKTNETIKTVDGTVATVKNNLDKTKSIVTQLSNLFDVTVGDSSVSVTNNGVLVKGKQIHIDGQTLIDNGVIQGAKIADASIGTAKIADAAITSAKIANLDVNKLSGNKSTFVQSVWNGISNSVNITPTGLESASGSNQTTITGGRIETNSLWAKDYITVGRHESDPRQRWGIDIDRKGMWFGVPVKKNGAVGNNAGDYQYEIQGAIKGYGWDYARTEINGNGASGIMIGLAEQGMWSGNYGGDFIGIGRFVKNEYQTLDSAQHDFALTYNATGAGFAVPGNAVHIWKDTYIHGVTHLGYNGSTKNRVGIRTAWVSWSDWHNERYACLVNDGPYWGGIAFPYNGNTVIFSFSGKRDSWAGSGTQYTGYGDY